MAIGDGIFLPAESKRYAVWFRVSRYPADKNLVPRWVRDTEKDRAKSVGLPEPEYIRTKPPAGFGKFMRAGYG